MRLTITKFVLFMVFAVCFLTTQVAAKHQHTDCDEDDHDWDDWKNHASSTIHMPMSDSRPTGYSSRATATVTFVVTSTQVFTATAVPSNPSQPPTGSMASVKSMGISMTLAAIMFTMIIVA